MTNRTTPWDDIELPDGNFSVRQINRESPILCWGRDAENQCLFIIGLSGDHLKWFNQNCGTINIQGIAVDLIRGPQNFSVDQIVNQLFVLILKNDDNRDLFYGLCKTLVEELQLVRSEFEALSVTITHIKRWQKFLAGKSVRKGLGDEAIRGLYAELLFLQSLYRKKNDQNAAVESWCGHNPDAQDFLFDNKAVEVKSLFGKERNIIRIASEEQLEYTRGPLFLVMYHLGNNVSNTDEGFESLSLNELVNEINQELTERKVLSKFSEHLIGRGYVPIEKYDEPKFEVIATDAYRVSEDFPRLIRSELPKGIVNVLYGIKIEAIQKFKCDDISKVWEEC